MSKHTAEGIWATLSAIDVSAKTEQKNGMTYLSWAWAWGVLMENFPEAEITWERWADRNGVEHDCLFYPDGTVSVSCIMRIGDVTRTAWLPVMDNRMNAMTNPTARDISDTKMRCMVKCMAFFGLGHYIYAGEDLPSDSAATSKLIDEVMALGVKAGAAGKEVDDTTRGKIKGAVAANDFMMLTSLKESLTLLVGAPA